MLTGVSVRFHLRESFKFFFTVSLRVSCRVSGGFNAEFDLGFLENFI